MVLNFQSIFGKHSQIMKFEVNFMPPFMMGFPLLSPDPATIFKIFFSMDEMLNISITKKIPMFLHF